MLIDKTYFVAELNVPNWNTDSVGRLLDAFIDKYEDQFLRYALGLELYTAFQAGLLGTPVMLQRWVDLRDGVAYTYGNRQWQWRGLRQAAAKQSPIANYVYYWFMRDGFTQSTTMGEANTNKENATSTNPGAKMVRAWNEMAQQVYSLQHYMRATVSTYPEWQSNLLWVSSRHFQPINEFNI